MNLPDPAIHLKRQKDHVNEFALADAAGIVVAGDEGTSAADVEVAGAEAVAGLLELLLATGLHQWASACHCN